MGFSDNDAFSGKKYSYKQCPECSEKLPLNAKRCTQCGQKTGVVRPDGKAKKPIDWKGYFVSFIFIAILVIYLRWAFL